MPKATIATSSAVYPMRFAGWTRDGDPGPAEPRTGSGFHAGDST